MKKQTYAVDLTSDATITARVWKVLWFCNESLLPEHAAAVVAAVAVFPESGAGAAASSPGQCGAGMTVRCSGAVRALKIEKISKAKPAKD